MFVKSTSRKPFEFSWDGVKYMIGPGDTTEIPAGAARNIFGYENPNLESILVSLGFVKHSEDVEKAMKFFSLFTVSQHGEAPAQTPADHDGSSTRSAPSHPDDK